MKKITVIIPCHNEEKGIAKVLDHMPRRRLSELGYLTEVIIIDNNSTDRTAEIARSKNAAVIFEAAKGKGNAIKTGFNMVSHDTDYVVMLDGDNTYKPKEIIRLIEPLESGFCEVIVGSRLGGKMQKNSLKLQNRVANWVYTFLVRQFYRANVTDVLSGYFAWKKEVVDELSQHLTSSGFAIEMEMITKMVKLGHEMYSVPITYDERDGHSKISSITDGIKILFMFFKNLAWTPKKTKSSYQTRKTSAQQENSNVTYTN
jgi:glycosyltransferase involved in cell wall biosynthesis